jgi:hypothetical protein
MLWDTALVYNSDCSRLLERLAAHEVIDMEDKIHWTKFPSAFSMIRKSAPFGLTRVPNGGFLVKSLQIVRGSNSWRPTVKKNDRLLNHRWCYHSCYHEQEDVMTEDDEK